MRIFDSKSRKLEELTPQDGKTIRMYTCGPTVYNYAHIGNLRTYVFEDLLRRAIQYFGYEVVQVMNLTDVDDKTIRGANKEGVSLNEFTKTYKEAFFQDLERLNVQKAEHYPAATEHVEQMILLIDELIKKDAAYVASDGNVFFRISAFPAYGRLSHLNIAELKTGASMRVEDDEYDKESLSDFVLWKAYDEDRDGSVVWDAPWGKGRPGWHIECSAMAMHILGETLDLHIGGEDNKFPHHENEIAQSEACTGKVFSRFWMHSRHLVVDGKKMSKSLGNFFTLNDLLEKGYSGREVRYLLLSTHYRHTLNFTFAGLESAQMSLQRIDDFLERLSLVDGEGGGHFLDFLKEKEDIFSKAIEDDLNISEALAALFDLIRECNTLIDQNVLGKSGASFIKNALEKFDSVLGVIFSEKEEIPHEVIVLAEKRLEARNNKDWALADTLRDQIAKEGYLVKDTSKGFTLSKI